jgi:hypothetical protein
MHKSKGAGISGLTTATEFRIGPTSENEVEVHIRRSTRSALPAVGLAALAGRSQQRGNYRWSWSRSGHAAGVRP